MRAASAAPLTSILGSLGLHGAAALLLALSAQKPLELPREARPLTNAWLGNAVEVDAVARPDAIPKLASQASAQAPPKPGAALIEPGSPPAEARVRQVTRRAEANAEPGVARRAEPRGPRLAASRSAGAPLSGEGPHETSTAPSSGVFGSEGWPAGVRSLSSAFTRAIPPATAADPIWQSLPPGTQRPFMLEVRIDARGHIGSAQIVGLRDGGDQAAPFEHVRQRVMGLLGGGLFAPRNSASAGRELFRITITLSDRAARDDSAPAALVERGFEPPLGKSPGRAYFTLASGRHFEAKVEVLSAPGRLEHP